MKYSYDISRGIQKLKSKTSTIFSALALGVTSIITVIAIPIAAHASSSAIYNNIPNSQPRNVVSLGFEATGTSEFGGEVSFVGSARSNPTVTVLMSSWGCENGNWHSNNCSTTPGATFPVPITLNVYNTGTGTTQGSAPGSLITSVTKSFAIPYRPSADTRCTNDAAGKWFSTADNTCYNGYATPISFNLANITLPAQAVISVAYNTSDYGHAPVGHSACSAATTTAAGCGYDSLNVGTADSLTVGSQLKPNDAYQDTLNDSCINNGPLTPFGLDVGCWTGYQPAFKVTASQALPTSKDNCKNDGWKTYGSTFKNQGDCVSFVATNGKNQP